MVLTKNVWKKAQKFGIKTRKELHYRIDMAAPTTHSLGNRRYEDFIFKTQDGVVIDVNLDQPQDPKVCIDCGDDGDFCLTCRTL